MFRTRRRRRPVSTLFHYTSPVGLDGILKSHSVWASSINYLNDEDEFTFAFRRMLSVLKPFVKDRPDLKPWVETIADYNSRSAGIHVGVFSLSEEPDLLSQWRGYAPSGFSIGFSLHRLAEIAEAADYTLAKCVYENREQRRRLREILVDSVALYDRKIADGTPKDVALEEAGHRLLVNTIRLAPLLKNPAFAEEREWRLISGIRRANSGEWQIRVKGTHFVPYLVLWLGKTEDSPIIQIIVGPHPQSEVAYLGVHQLRHSYKVNASIKKSRTPYRSMS